MTNKETTKYRKALQAFINKHCNKVVSLREIFLTVYNDDKNMMFVFNGFKIYMFDGVYYVRTKYGDKLLETF